MPFFQISAEYKSMIDQINNNCIKSIYTGDNFKFKFLCFPYTKISQNKKNNTDEVKEFFRNCIVDSFNYCKFLTIQSTKIESDNLFGLVICGEKKCTIIQSINKESINTLIKYFKKQKMSIINVSLNDNENESLIEKEAKEEINNFCKEFQDEIDHNEFVKLTIAPIVGYIIRRYFYPIDYFGFSSFLEFNETKEFNIRKYLSLLLTSTTDMQYTSYYNPLIINSEEYKDDDNKLIDFEEKDFITLRNIHSNENSSCNLVLHINSFYIFMMKKINNPDKISKELQREIDFDKINYHNRSFTKFYGFVKENGKIIGFIYEYMCNGTLIDYKEHITPTFSLMTIKRIFDGIKYLQQHSLIHNLDPSNIYLDHDFRPYIFGFESICKADTTPSKISFKSIIYFLYEKEEINPNIKNIYDDCIKTNQDEKQTFEKIEKIINEEIDNFEQYLQDEDKNNNNLELTNILTESILIHVYTRSLQDYLQKFLISTLSFCKIKDSNKGILIHSIAYDYEEKQNYSKANKYFELSLKYGFKDSLFYLGWNYQNGLGFHQDYKKAYEYYFQSADNYNSGAFECLGDLYYNGFGVKEDKIEALNYYKKAVDHGNSKALAKIGNMYLKGIGIEKELNTALKYYHLSVKYNDLNFTFILKDVVAKEIKDNLNNELNAQSLKQSQDKLLSERLLSLDPESNKKPKKNYDPELLFYLGYMYEKGINCEQNIDEAKIYYEMSAEEKNSDSICRLGIISSYRNDYKTALKLIQDSAVLGNSIAYYYLGCYYYNVNGEEKNINKAINEFELSSNLNNSDAFLSLGYIYLNNDEFKDNKKVLEYLESSANLNNSEALTMLGIIYFEGKIVQQNYMKSKQYFELASKQDNPISFLYLGKIYYNGFGIEKDYKKAIKYYDYAAQLNNSEALFELGCFYTGDIYTIDIPKAINYFMKCINLGITSIKPTNLFLPIINNNTIVNKYYYHSLNDLGLIYIIIYNNIETAEKFIIKAALSDYQYAKNNYGLLNQFYLNDESKAADFYQRASENHFHLSEFNLGKMKEKLGEINQSIEHYKIASNYEYVPSDFLGTYYNDKRLQISTKFITCLTNLKLFNYYARLNQDESKNYFIKSLSKLKNDQKRPRFYLSHHKNNPDDVFSYLEYYILIFSEFNLIKQPNITNEIMKKLNDLRNKWEKIDSKDQNEEVSDQPENENPTESDSSTNDTSDDSDDNILMEKINKFINNNNNNNNNNSSDNDNEGNNTNDDDDDTNHNRNIFDDPELLYNFILEDERLKNVFNDKIDDIIKTMEDILYQPPYNILFGRIVINANKDSRRPDINIDFYDGLDLN